MLCKSYVLLFNWVWQSAAQTYFTMLDHQMRKMSAHNDLKHSNPTKHPNPKKTNIQKQTNVSNVYKKSDSSQIVPPHLKDNIWERVNVFSSNLLGFFHTQLLPSLRKPCKIWLNQIEPLPGTPTRKTSEGFTNGACCWACSFNPILWWGIAKECEGLDLSIKHHHISYELQEYTGRPSF